MLNGLLSFLGFRRSGPVMVVELPCTLIEDWKINYTRHDQIVITGWVNGSWTTSGFIKSVKGGVATDVYGKRYKVGKCDGGEWAYSLQIRYPHLWQMCHDGGIL